MIEKKMSPKGKSCRVTFELPADVAKESVAVVGDFNDWDKSKHQMSLDEKNGVWKTTVALKPGTAYQFRYFVDEREWRNDEQADRFVSNEFFSENSVIEL